MAKKHRGKFLLGAPLTADGFSRAVQSLQTELPESDRMETLANYVNLNTSKTIGVLTVASIVFAAVAVFTNKIPPAAVNAAAVACVLAVLLLLSNLWSSWRRDNLDFHRSLRSEIYVLEVLASRMVRLSIATLLVGFSIVTLLSGLLLQTVELPVGWGDWVRPIYESAMSAIPASD